MPHCWKSHVVAHIYLPGSAVTLNVFEEADWMKNVSQERLFDKRPDGTFIARHTGIYLLYTHVCMHLIVDTFMKRARKNNLLIYFL